MWNIETWKITILPWYPNKMQQYHQQNHIWGDWCWTNLQIPVAFLETHNEYFGFQNQLSWNVDLEWGFDII